MKISQAFPTKYLSAADLNGMEATVTITNVTMENIEGDQAKPVVHLAESSKGFVLNKTNASMIAQLYGDDTDGWSGKQLILFPMMVDFRGEMKNAIRCRSPQQAQPFVPQQNALQAPSQTPSQAHPMAPGGIGNPPADFDDEVPF